MDRVVRDKNRRAASAAAATVNQTSQTKSRGGQILNHMLAQLNPWVLNLPPEPLIP